jgi:CHRD domain
MRKIIVAALLGALVTALATGSFAIAKGSRDGDGGKRSFRVKLDGWQEDPSQVTVARGDFRMRVVNPDLIEFWLSYTGLEGPVQQAHIHIGNHHENGGISAWLCKTPGFAPPPPALAPEETCPQSGELHGFIERRDITGPTGQGVEPGNMEDFLRAARHGDAYANVHSGRAPGGEIRGDFNRHDEDYRRGGDDD